MKQPIVKFAKLDPAVQIPTYTRPGDAGMDLRTAEKFKLDPGERKVVTTGLRVKVQDGFEGQVRPRSGLAANHGIMIVNTPGTIDSNFTGELKLIVLNTGNDVVGFDAGDRVAQMIIAPVLQAQTMEVTVEELEDTNRGAAGLGSSGVK